MGAPLSQAGVRNHSQPPTPEPNAAVGDEKGMRPFEGSGRLAMRTQANELNRTRTLFRMRRLKQMSKQCILLDSLSPLIGVDSMKNGKNGQTESALREERLQIMLDADELRAVDTFRFAHRMPSRAAAVRELFRLGLTVARTGAGSVATEGAKSSDYGVLSQRKIRE